MFKTIFARFGNIKAGKFVDDETGESLNDVAKVLSKFNIELYDSEGNMRNVNTILTELSQGWENYTQVQKNAIASAVAGVRQYENFIVLMNNFGKAQDYAGIATESAGIAMEKFGGYTEGIEATMNKLKTSVEEVALKFIDSETIITIMETLSNVVGFLADNVWILELAFKSLMTLGIGKAIGLIGNKFAALSLKTVNANYAFNIMKSVNKQVSAGMMSTASATNYYARALQLLGFQTTNVTTKEAIRQLKYIGLWKTLKGLSAEEQKRILMGIYNNEQLVQEIVGTTALAGANNTLSFSFKGLTASIKAMMASNPLGWIMLAISAVIELVSWLSSAEEETDELANADLQTLAENLKTTKAEAEEAQKALEDNIKAIDELLSKQSLTYVEDKELEKLKEATQELRWQKQIKDQGAKKATTDFFSGFNSNYGLELSTLNTDFSKLIENISKPLPETYNSDYNLVSDMEKYLNDIVAKYLQDPSQVESGPPFIPAILQIFKETKGKIDEYYSLGVDESFIEEKEEELGRYSSYLRGQLSIMQDYIENINNLSEKEKIQLLGRNWEEDLQNVINLRDAILLTTDPEQYEELKFSDFLASDDLKEIKNLVDELGFKGDLTTNILKNKLGIEGFGNLTKKIDAAALSLQDFILWLNSQKDIDEKVAQSISAIKEEIEKLKEVYSTISKGLEEYNNQGYFNFETMEKILDLGNEYIGYLIDENGNIRENANALEDYLRLRLQERAYLQAVDYVKSFANKTDEEAIKIIQGKTLATKGATQADLEFLASQVAILSVSPEVKMQILKQALAMIKYATNTSFASDSTKDAKEATKDWEAVLSYANKILEDQIEKLKEQKEAIKKSIEEQIKAKKKEIDLLEKEKEALEDKNEEKNKEIELEELQRNLQKAKQRTMRVYHADKGWVWEQDPEAVKEAQQELDDFYTEQKIDNIDKRIEKLEEEIEALEKSTDDSEDTYDKRLKMLDEQIKKAEDYKDKWNNVKAEHEQAQNAITAKAELGANAEKGILAGRMKVFNGFKKKYIGALNAVAKSTENKVSRTNGALDGLLDAYDKILKMPVSADTLLYGKKSHTVDNPVHKKYGSNVGIAKIITNSKGTKFVYDDAMGVYYRYSDVEILSGVRGDTIVIPYSTDAYMQIPEFASGTKSAKSGLANVDEKGNELIIPKQGRYRMMEYGDIVVPHNLSQRIFDIATNPKQFVSNVLGSFKSPNLMNNSNTNIRSSSSTINIGTIELPSVNNGESFIKQLQLISANR